MKAFTSLPQIFRICLLSISTVSALADPCQLCTGEGNCGQITFNTRCYGDTDCVWIWTPTCAQLTMSACVRYSDCGKWGGSPTIPVSWSISGGGEDFAIDGPTTGDCITIKLVGDPEEVSDVVIQVTATGENGVTRKGIVWVYPSGDEHGCIPECETIEKCLSCNSQWASPGACPPGALS